MEGKVLGINQTLVYPFRCGLWNVTLFNFDVWKKGVEKPLNYKTMYKYASHCKSFDSNYFSIEIS